MKTQLAKLASASLLISAFSASPASADTLTASSTAINRATACASSKSRAQTLVSNTYAGRMEVYDLSACDCSLQDTIPPQWTCTTTAYFQPRRASSSSSPSAPTATKPIVRPPVTLKRGQF
jgi:hypothetical protein